MKFIKKHVKIIVSVLHGIFLFIGLWLITNSSYSSAADEGILKQVNNWETKLFNSRNHVDLDFVFINVSRDQKLVSDPADYGEISITDRSKLAGFFKILADNGNKHKYALCDIFFENPDADDSLLHAETWRCKKLLFPYHITADTLQKPCINVPVALSDFVTYTGNFSKFKLLYNDTVQTTPLALLKQIDNKQYPVSFLNFKSIFPQYYIQGNDLLPKKKYPYYNLGELLMLAGIDSFYNDFLKNKFIVIGNFDTDVHYSPAGKIAGPLILLNTYLTLRNHARVSWWWAFFMVVALSCISYVLFYKKIKASRTSKNIWLDFILQFFINDYISFSGICLLLVILSSFIFSIQLNIAILLSYLLFFTFVKQFYNRHKKTSI